MNIAEALRRLRENGTLRDATGEENLLLATDINEPVATAAQILAGKCAAGRSGLTPVFLPSEFIQPLP